MTASAPGLYADQPNNFGMPLERLADSTAKGPVPEEQGPVGTGHVFIGVAEILDLEMAAGIRAARGAEAGVFDPALVKLLAKSYSLGEAEANSTTPSQAGSAASLSDVAKACKHNLDVAAAAGLKCRSAVWSSVLTLLPLPQPVTVTSHTIPDLATASRDRIFNSSSSGSGSVEESQVPFASELLGAILLELLEGGDCQHFTVLCELLKRAGLLEAATGAGGISKVPQSAPQLNTS